MYACRYEGYKAWKQFERMFANKGGRRQERKSKKVNKKASKQSARISATMKKEKEASKLQECLGIMRYESKKAKRKQEGKPKQD